MKEGFLSRLRQRAVPREDTPLPQDIFNLEQKRDFRSTLQELQGLYNFIAGIHERNEKYGISSMAHSIDHDLAVATFAHAIARKYDKKLAKHATAAALVHSYDRFRASPYEHTDPFNPEDVKQWVDQYLPDMTTDERHEIVEAAVSHNKPNKGKKIAEPTIADVLADADKLAGLMSYSILRHGQYLPAEPAIRIGNADRMTSGANYHKHNVAMDNIHGSKEWLDDKSWFVTPEALRIVPTYEAPFRRFVEESRKQLDDIGLDTLPPRTL